MSAIFRAVNDYMNQRLKSRNVHSEIVFSLSPANNVRFTLEFHSRHYTATNSVQIADSFRKFGITDSTKDLLVVKVSVSSEITHDSVATHLGSSIQGTSLPFDDETLAEISDVSKIKKAYKLGALSSPATMADSALCNGTQDHDAIRRLELSLLGAIALRGS